MKCDECNKNNGHEIWCCLSRHAAPVAVTSNTWVGYNEAGKLVMRQDFPPHKTAEGVLAWMQERPMFGQIVVRVEVA